MRNHQCQGIILRAKPINDTDKFVTILTQRFGRIDAIAKGATKITGKFASSMDTLNLCQFELYKSKTWLIREAQILNSFTEIKMNLLASQTANLILTLIHKTTHGGESDLECFVLLKKTLSGLQKNIAQTQKTLKQFQIELLRIHGMLPEKPSSVSIQSLISQWT